MDKVEQVEAKVGVDAINNEQEQVEAIEQANDTNLDDTSYGKFKSADELLKAYNSLESEFTKRSQKLKEFENTTQQDKEIPPDEPMYMASDWQLKVAEFVRDNPQAREYSEEIASIIMQDDALAKDKRCLEVAYDRVLAGKFRPPQKLLEDREFVESYILRNDKIKESIISEYIDSLNKRQPPEVITKRGEISLTPPDRPKTIAEAGELATKMMNRR